MMDGALLLVRDERWNSIFEAVRRGRHGRKGEANVVATLFRLSRNPAILTSIEGERAAVRGKAANPGTIELTIELRVKINKPTSSHVRILEKIGEVMRQTLPGAEVGIVREDEPRASPWGRTPADPPAEAVESTLAEGTVEDNRAPALPLADQLDLSGLPPIRTNEARWKWEFLKNKLVTHSFTFGLSILGAGSITSALGREPDFVAFLGAAVLHALAYFLGFVGWSEKIFLEQKIRKTTCTSCQTAFVLKSTSVVIAERQIMKQKGAEGMCIYNEETRQKVAYCTECGYKAAGEIYKEGRFV